MYRLITGSLALAAVVGVGLAVVVGTQETVVKRGAPIGDSPVVDLADALESVSTYADQTVTVEGTVNRVCQMKGCWMELMPDGADRGIRVTFKDYAFFVPTDSGGAAARLEGTFERNTFSKAGRRPPHRRGRGPDAQSRRDRDRGQFRRAGGRAADVGWRTVTSTKLVVQQHWSPPPPLPDMSLAVIISR